MSHPDTTTTAAAAPPPPPANEDLAEEIDAINAIYGADTLTLTPTTTTTTTGINNDPPSSDQHPSPIQTTLILRLPEHKHLSSFLVGFDAAYPSTPPRVLGTASTSARGEGKRWTDMLSDAVGRAWTPGAVCLFDVIGDAGEKVAEVVEAQNAAAPAPAAGVADKGGEEDERGGETNDEHERVEKDGVGGSREGMSEPHTVRSSEGQESSLHIGGLALHDPPPDWVVSQAVTEKKSVFVARAVTVQTKSQTEAYLDHLLATEKKVAAATHNITAWRIREKQKKIRSTSTSTPAPAATAAAGPGDDVTVVQDYDDDGEAAAGGRLLHLMQMMDVWNVLVVVSRWYGGVKLGPDRFRLINAVARDALVTGGFVKSNTSDAQEKGKKRGKR